MNINKRINSRMSKLDRDLYPVQEINAETDLNYVKITRFSRKDLTA